MQAECKSSQNENACVCMPQGTITGTALRVGAAACHLGAIAFECSRRKIASNSIITMPPMIPDIRLTAVEKSSAPVYRPPKMTTCKQHPSIACHCDGSNSHAKRNARGGSLLKSAVQPQKMLRQALLQDFVGCKYHCSQFSLVLTVWTASETGHELAISASHAQKLPACTRGHPPTMKACGNNLPMPYFRSAE